MGTRKIARHESTRHPHHPEFNRVERTENPPLYTIEDHAEVVRAGRFFHYSCKVAGRREFDTRIRPVLRDLSIRPINWFWTKDGMTVTLRTAEEAVLLKLFDVG